MGSTSAHFDPSLCRLAGDYERHSAQALEDPEKYLSNPVNAFLMVKRFTVDWQNILQTFLDVNHAQGTSELSMGWVDPWVGLVWVEIFSFW